VLLIHGSVFAGYRCPLGENSLVAHDIMIVETDIFSPCVLRHIENADHTDINRRINAMAKRLAAMWVGGESVGKKPAKVADNMAQKLIGRWHRIRWLNAFVMLEDLLNHASLRQSCPIPAHCQAAYARIVLAGAFAYTHGLHMGFVFYPDRTVDG